MPLPQPSRPQRIRLVRLSWSLLIVIAVLSLICQVIIGALLDVMVDMDIAVTLQVHLQVLPQALHLLDHPAGLFYLPTVLTVHAVNRRDVIKRGKASMALPNFYVMETSFILMSA